MKKKYLGILVGFLWVLQMGCQGFTYNHPQFGVHGRKVANANQAQGDFELPDEKPKNLWLLVGVVGGLAVGSAVVGTLYVTDKL